MKQCGQWGLGYFCPRSSTRQKEKNASRTRSPRGKRPTGRMFRFPCKDYFKGSCTISICEKWHLPECFFCKSEAELGISARRASPGWRTLQQKVSKKSVDKSAVAFFFGRKIIQQLGLRILKIWSRRSLHRFWSRAQAVVRHADIWDQNPSHGMICPGDSHQRNPNSPKFEGRSQEVTECQWRCARWAAWRLAKKILKLKVKQSTAFFTLSDNWCLLAPSSFET